MFGRPVRSPYAYFYPRPPRGGRLLLLMVLTSFMVFLSTPSARRATWGRTRCAPTFRGFLSTPSARRATLAVILDAVDVQFLSTPSARRATVSHNDPDYLLQISIHALREEGDRGTSMNAATKTLFLSTPSARRATRGGIQMFERLKISIHALREEGDNEGILGTVGTL